MYQASNRPESPPNCPSKTAPTDDAQDTNYWDQIKNKKGPLGAMQADLPRTAQQWPGTLPEKQLKSRPKEEEDMITGELGSKEYLFIGGTGRLVFNSGW